MQTLNMSSENAAIDPLYVIRGSGIGVVFDLAQTDVFATLLVSCIYVLEPSPSSRVR